MAIIRTAAATAVVTLMTGLLPVAATAHAADMATTVVYDKPLANNGVYTWTVPKFAYYMTLELWGGAAGIADTGGAGGAAANKSGARCSTNMGIPTESGGTGGIHGSPTSSPDAGSGGNSGKSNPKNYGQGGGRRTGRRVRARALPAR